jgi:predicted membrane protein
MSWKRFTSFIIMIFFMVLLFILLFYPLIWESSTYDIFYIFFAQLVANIMGYSMFILIYFVGVFALIVLIIKKIFKSIDK